MSVEFVEVSEPDVSTLTAWLVVLDLSSDFVVLFVRDDSSDSDRLELSVNAFDFMFDLDDEEDTPTLFV